MSISTIKRIDTSGSAFVPPLTDYKRASQGWKETEFRALSGPSTQVVVGFWRGEAGTVTLERLAAD